MSKNRGKLTATDVLALINSVDALSPLDTAFNAREALQKAVDLGKSAFFDKATFSAAQRMFDAWSTLPIQQPQPITPQQMVAARSLLGWSRQRLAAWSDTAVPFISTYENDGRVTNLMSREPSFDGLASIRATLEQAGVIFTKGEEHGVRLRTSGN